MLKGEVIEFERKKHFKYIGPLGSGGTGDAQLFEDEFTKLKYAFKKYSPKNLEYIDEYYSRFIDEIKILFQISHPNIVRVYNYYLYPDAKVGYLQMEYFQGEAINEYAVVPWENSWNDIFKETILSFKYLEANAILHRDIRPQNILVNPQGDIKIIDFGFGKKLEQAEKDGKSVVLNWPVTNLPKETLRDGTYNHQTEIYFVGKLFKNIPNLNDFDFRYKHILEK